MSGKIAPVSAYNSKSDNNNSFFIQLQQKFNLLVSYFNRLPAATSEMIKAYGQAYRKTTYQIVANNTWYVIGFSGGINNLKNVTLGSFDATNGEDTENKLTVTYAGVYKITYKVQFTSAGAADCVVRIIKNNSSEIVGSYSQMWVTSSNIGHAVANSVIVTLSANDFIALQVGSDLAGGNTYVFYYDSGNLPDPTDFISAVLTIEKIDDI